MATRGYQLLDAANPTSQVILKYINIGDLDMAAFSTAAVAHGLDLTKIIGIKAMIRNDADDTYYPLTRGSSGTPVDGSIESVDATNVNLARASSGMFNSTDFDSTNYNRGWVQIDYLV